MAITGSGTEQDPWIVHSYDEIKSCIEGLDSDQLKYLKLGNDINCNDYGSSWEWETISVNWNNRQFNLDLDGHTIKNVKVKSGNYMFVYSGSGNTKIHNGKLLNVFLSGSNGIIGARYGLYNQINLEKLSISTDATGLANAAIALGCAYITACAIYYQAASVITNNAVIDSPNITSGASTVINSDIVLNCDNQNALYLFGDYTRFEGCRMRGYTKGNPPYSGNYNNARCTFRNSFNSCVFEFDNREYGGDYAPSLILGFDSNSGTIMNKDVCVGYPDSWNAVTSEEIRNGAALRAKGFTVVNVQR